MRLFVAVELPDELKQALVGLRADIPGAHWVPAEQIHLTLAFPGEVDQMTSERLISELARIRSPLFQLRLSGTGCFPDRRRPRVLWIGVEPQPLLMDLATQVQAAVLFCGIPQEERPFSAHITLARLKLPASRECGAFLDRYPNLKLMSFLVREFILFESRLTRQGAIHTPIKNFLLAAPTANGQSHNTVDPQLTTP